MASKRYGLRLSLGGAPLTPHHVANPDGDGWLPGVYHPVDVVEVPNETLGVSLAQAQQWAASPGVPLELVEIESDTKRKEG